MALMVHILHRLQWGLMPPLVTWGNSFVLNGNCTQLIHHSNCFDYNDHHFAILNV